MCDRWRGTSRAPRHRDAGQQVTRDGQRPDHVPRWLVERQRRDPDRHPEAQPQRVLPRQPRELRIRAPRAGIQRDDVGAKQRVGDDIAVAPTLERRRDRGREPGYQQHRGEQHEAEQALVGVEQVADVRVRRPRPGDGHEQPDERGRARERQMLVQPAGQLRDGDDEDQIEEQLGPGRVALGALLRRLLQAQDRYPLS
jgi:hypothetical protein